MPEQFRDQLPNPTLFSDALAKGGSNAWASEVVANAKPNIATQDYPEVAYDVAQAVKPEIDAVANLHELKQVHDPMQYAASRDIEGGTQLVGVTPFAGESALTAKKADLERNAQYATELAKKQHVGGAALQLLESKQKVANMNQG